MRLIIATPSTVASRIAPEIVFEACTSVWRTFLPVATTESNRTSSLWEYSLSVGTSSTLINMQQLKQRAVLGGYSQFHILLFNYHTNWMWGSPRPRLTEGKSSMTLSVTLTEGENTIRQSRKSCVTQLHRSLRQFYKFSVPYADAINSAEKLLTL